MTKNLKCRKQVRETLASMIVGDEFSLDSFVEAIREPRTLVERGLLQRQPAQRVAMILAEYVRHGIVEKAKVVSRSVVAYRLVKSVE